jgi:hypothetical protein
MNRYKRCFQFERAPVHHGSPCAERECAVDQRCGPIYGFKVCAAGLECSARGVCSAMVGRCILKLVETNAESTPHPISAIETKIV